MSQSLVKPLQIFYDVCACTWCGSLIWTLKRYKLQTYLLFSMIAATLNVYFMHPVESDTHLQWRKWYSRETLQQKEDAEEKVSFQSEFNWNRHTNTKPYNRMNESSICSHSRLVDRSVVSIVSIYRAHIFLDWIKWAREMTELWYSYVFYMIISLFSYPNPTASLSIP